MKINNKTYINEFYLVLNDLENDEFANDFVILGRTKPLYKTKYGYQDVSKYTPGHVPPPDLGILSFDRDMFNLLISENILDSSETEFMYLSIDSTQTILIDSSKVVNQIVVSESITEKFYNHKTWYSIFKEIERKYGTPKFLVTSPPVFNSDFTKVIIAVDLHYSMVFGICYKKSIWGMENN